MAREKVSWVDEYVEVCMSVEEVEDDTVKSLKEPCPGLTGTFEHQAFSKQLGQSRRFPEAQEPKGRQLQNIRQ